MWTFEFILLFYLISFAFLVQVVSENANYLRTPRTLVEQKQNPTVGTWSENYEFRTLRSLFCTHVKPFSGENMTQCYALVFI